MWQTPESMQPEWERKLGEGHADHLDGHDLQREVAGLELGAARLAVLGDARQAERLTVERDGGIVVLRRDHHEVDACDDFSCGAHRSGSLLRARVLRHAAGFQQACDRSACVSCSPPPCSC